MKTCSFIKRKGIQFSMNFAIINLSHTNKKKYVTIRIRKSLKERQRDRKMFYFNNAHWVAQEHRSLDVFSKKKENATQKTDDVIDGTIVMQT